MKELNLEYVKKHYNIIKKINSDIYLISINKEKYIFKKITMPMGYDALVEQHKYIKFLIENGIDTADIILRHQNDGCLYEIQEYIDNDLKDIEIEELIKTISKYHAISNIYNHNILKNNVYKYEFKCRNTKLNNLLLGFREKYYIYPMRNFQKNLYLIASDKLIYINKILEIYHDCYNYFITNYYKEKCIIHNDITSNNVISSNNKLYLIDFDLAINSSIYVDFIDCVIKRYKTIDELALNLEIVKENIIKYIDIYNEYNKDNRVDYTGSICMLILKLLSFNLYVLLSEENKELFNNKLPILYSVIEKLYNYLKEERYDTKCKKRRC